jgi:hypothetical protein
MNGPKFLPRTVKEYALFWNTTSKSWSAIQHDLYLVQRPARLVYRVRAPRVGLNPAIVTGAAPGGKYSN